MKKSKKYRALETLPAALTWSTLIGAIVFSYFAPLWVAIYIIVFDVYWVLKSVNTAMHLLSSFGKLKLYSKYDWMQRLRLLQSPDDYFKSLSERARMSSRRLERTDLVHELKRLRKIDFKNRLTDFRQIRHLVILTVQEETLDVVANSINSVLDADFPKEQIFFVLALEERGLLKTKELVTTLRERYQDVFLRFEAIIHPDGIAGEAKVKGANLTFAAKRAIEMLDQLSIRAEQVIVSAFDSDTIVSKNYFAYLTYEFLTAEKPYKTSYQPMPIYNNNIWDAPAITRVVAVANSFWQMVEASRPDRLVTFSSHALSLKALKEVDFWPVDVIPDDSRIFWKCFLHYHGDYRTKPLFTHLSFDAVLDESYFKTLKAQYKQKRRWAWGVTEVPYVLSRIWAGDLIPLWKKFIYSERLLEGHYFWATASIMIAVLGWLPLILGGARFEEGALAFNLPLLTRSIMQIATIFLIFSVYINMILLPKRPEKYSRWRSWSMIVQWVFVPIVSTVFGSLPAIDAQTRLALGKYLEFWVTPKVRKSEIKNSSSVFARREET